MSGNNRNQKPKRLGPLPYYPALPERWIDGEVEGQLS